MSPGLPVPPNFGLLASKKTAVLFLWNTSSIVPPIPFLKFGLIPTSVRKFSALTTGDKLN